MSTFPELETPRLRLRCLVADDAEELLCHWSDPEVMEYLTLDPMRTLAEARDMVDLLGGLFDKGIGIRWGITCKTKGTLLGTCGFHNVRWEHRRGELGYELGKASWRKGIMTEALSAAIGYGFSEMNFHRIEALVTEGNERSRALLVKLGFAFEGLLRDYEFARGRFLGQWCHSLLRSEWGGKKLQKSPKSLA